MDAKTLSGLLDMGKPTAALEDQHLPDSGATVATLQNILIKSKRKAGATKAAAGIKKAALAKGIITDNNWNGEQRNRLTTSNTSSKTESVSQAHFDETKLSCLHTDAIDSCYAALLMQMPPEDKRKTTGGTAPRAARFLIWRIHSK